MRRWSVLLHSGEQESDLFSQDFITATVFLEIICWKNEHSKLDS